MPFHDADEKALLAKFHENGGELIVCFRNRRGSRRRFDPLQRPSNPVVTIFEIRALSRLLRSGHIVRAGSGDFGWVRYQLKDRFTNGDSS